MASEAQINANKRNALRSTGPTSPSGRARSAMNRRKHAIRSEQEKLGRDESISYQSRFIRWTGNYAPKSDPEEFLVHANLFVASQMDRSKRAYFELAQSAIDTAEDVEIEDVYSMGNLLFSDPRGVPAAMYGTRRFNVKKPGGPSWGSETAPVLDAGKLVRKLESSAMGCYWLLGVLEQLLEKVRESILVRGRSAADDQAAGGGIPVETLADRRVAEVFAASYALRPKGKPFDDLLSDMSEPALEAHVKEIAVMWPDLSQKDEKEKARQSLIDMVEGEIERIREIGAAHEQNTGEAAARIRALKAFENSPKAVAMRREFVKYKGSLERGLVALRKEQRARKADSDSEGLPPVPGKDISPYDGRPASWWREKAGGRTEGGRRRAEDGNQGGGLGQEDFAQDQDAKCGSGGAPADRGSDADVGMVGETGAGGGRSVAAASNEKSRGWDSVVVEESDVLACQGFLPERYTGIAGGSEPGAEVEDEAPNPAETGSSESGESGSCGTDLNVGGVGEVAREELAEAAGWGCDEGVDGSGDEVRNAEKTPNEANLRDDVFTAQHQDSIEVPTNSGGSSGLDNLETKPIFLETKPIPVGGSEAGGAGGSTQPVGRALTDFEQRAAWKEARRREWFRSRAEARERERLARLNAGVASAGADPGGAAGSQDVRGP